MGIQRLIDGATTTETGAAVRMDKNGPIPDNQTYQAAISGDGAVSATVVIEGSNDVSFGYVQMASFSLSGTNSDVDGAAYVGPWQYVRARISAISGTGATVDVIQGTA